MVSRTTQSEDKEPGLHQHDAMHVPSQMLAKETQSEGHELGTPRHSKKETQTSSKSQDVAELKDYVRKHMFP